MIGGGCDTIWRGDSKLASAALKLARHVRTKGRRGGILAELLELLLELVEFAQGACESPCLRVARMQVLSDPKLENPDVCGVACDAGTRCGRASVGSVRICAPQTILVLLAATHGRFDVLMTW